MTEPSIVRDVSYLSLDWILIAVLRASDNNNRIMFAASDAMLIAHLGCTIVAGERKFCGFTEMLAESEMALHKIQ